MDILAGNLWTLISTRARTKSYQVCLSAFDAGNYSIDALRSSNRDLVAQAYRYVAVTRGTGPSLLNLVPVTVPINLKRGAI